MRLQEKNPYSRIIYFDSFLLVVSQATFLFFRLKYLNGCLNGIHYADDVILQHEENVGILGVLVLHLAQQRQNIVPAMLDTLWQRSMSLVMDASRLCRSIL